MIALDFRSGLPIYEQIKERIAEQIAAGVMQRGAQLPSVRELAGQLSINPNTIARAYRELEAAGYVVSVPGKGSFVAEGDEALAGHRGALFSQLFKTAQSLRRLGVCDADIIKYSKEEWRND